MIDVSKEFGEVEPQIIEEQITCLKEHKLYWEPIKVQATGQIVDFDTVYVCRKCNPIEEVSKEPETNMK